MTEILLGLLSAAAGLGLFFWGRAAGEKPGKRQAATRPREEEPAEKPGEARRRAEEEAAFRTLMGYNIGQVYERADRMEGGR